MNPSLSLKQNVAFTDWGFHLLKNPSQGKAEASQSKLIRVCEPESKGVLALRGLERGEPARPSV